MIKTLRFYCASGVCMRSRTHAIRYRCGFGNGEGQLRRGCGEGAITLRNEDTGIETKTTSGENGDHTFEHVKSGEIR